MKDILQLFVCFLEICIPYWCMEKLVEKRNFPRIYKIFWYICVLVWIGLLYYQRSFGWYSRIYLLIEIAGIISLAKWNFRIKWIDAIISVSMFYESLYLLYLIVIAYEGYNNGLSSIVKMQTEMTWKGILISLFLLLFVALIFFMIFRVQKRVMFLKGMMDRKLLIVPVILYISLYICDGAFYNAERMVALRSVFFGTLICIGLFAFLLTYFYVKKAEHEVHILEKRIDAAEQKYKERIEGDKERDILVHDMQNHLIVIKKILEKKETERAKNYIEKLQEDYQSIRQSFHTGNVVIDAVLGSKICEAENAGISVKVISNELDGMFVSDRDGCSILANLVDNAINACKEMKGERWIRIRFENREWGMIWKIENSCLNTMEGRNTPKPERRKGIRHGTGLQSVRYAIQKYSGLLIQEKVECIFSTTVILYKQKGKEEAKYKKDILLKNI